VSTARFIVGDVFDGLASLPDESVDCIITSPPYFMKRRYLPEGHPEAHKELGREADPAGFLDGLLAVTDELWRVLAPHGTMWINLGDKMSGSGGAGGDYNAGGWREGQPRYGAGGASGQGWPLPKSTCWLPELLGASLAYGRNLLNGKACQQWVTRPKITWCKPDPTPGEIIDKFREASELIVFAVKSSVPGGYYFDLASVREPVNPENARDTRNQDGPKAKRSEENLRYTKRTSNPLGKPPLDWWVVPTGTGYQGAHFAVFPPALIVRPVIAGCPLRVCNACGLPSRPIVEPTPEYAAMLGSDMFSEKGRDRGVRDSLGKSRPDRRGVKRFSSEYVLSGWTDCGCEWDGDNLSPVSRWRSGVVLDPFGGSGTTGLVATGHGRDCVLIDIDERNAELARERIGMFLTVDSLAGRASAPPAIEETA
jgi:DNA modification methylase